MGTKVENFQFQVFFNCSFARQRLFGEIEGKYTSIDNYKQGSGR